MSSKKKQGAEQKQDTTWMEHIAPWPDRGLPVPRLEIAWTDDSGDGSWRSSTALYVMVYRHYADDAVTAVPLGKTKRDGTCPLRNGVVDTPFRDGVHMQADSVHLGLPAYATCGDVSTPVAPLWRAR